MPRWNQSKKPRRMCYCAECDRRLDKEEVVICASCYAELLMRTVYPAPEDVDVQDEPNEETEYEEEDEDETA